MEFDPNQLMELASRHGMPVVKALVIGLVGWLIAKMVAFGVRKVLERTDWDNRLARRVTGADAPEMAVEQGVARFVYWLLMLFVLVAELQSLGLTIITEPLNAMLSKVTGFLPQLLAAVALAGVAWAVASAVRLVLSNLLGALQLDRRIGEQTGQEQSFSLAKTLADTAYYLIFLLFLPQILDALRMEGLSPVRDMVGEIVGFLPNLLGAGVIFFLFFLVARIVQRLVSNLLRSVGFDQLPTWMGLGTPPADAASASTIAGWVALSILLALGAIQALNTLGLDLVSSLANELLQGMFNILVAAAIFGVGLMLSALVVKAIRASGRANAPLLAFLARAGILVFAGAMALRKTELAPEIVNLAFGALIVGLAAAAGLAFGLGGRDAAARAIESWRGSLQKPGTD